MMRMPFGKYRGQELADIPHDYLRWAYRNCGGISSRLRQAIAEEIGEQPRYQTHRPPPSPPQPPILDAILRQWVRTMTMRHHPDRGGSHDAMVAVNTGAELFRELASQLGGAS